MTSRGITFLRRRGWKVSRRSRTCIDAMIGLDHGGVMTITGEPMFVVRVAVGAERAYRIGEAVNGRAATSRH